MTPSALIDAPIGARCLISVLGPKIWTVLSHDSTNTMVHIKTDDGDELTISGTTRCMIQT